MAFLLTLSFADLRKEVNEYLFGGLGAPTANSADEDVVDRVIASGMRQFYSPPPVGNYTHEWSFLKPVTNTKLQAPYTNGSTNTATYDGSNVVSVTKLSVTSRSTGADTYTTASSHGFSVGDTVHIEKASDSDVVMTVKSVVSSTVFGVESASVSVITDNTFCYQPVPSWATSGFLDFDGVSYPVASVGTGDNSYKITLDSNDNPGESAIAAKTFKLHQDDYDLPVDFARMVGNITFSEKDNSWHTIRIVGEARIRELRQRDYAASSSTNPTLAAIVPKKTGTTAGSDSALAPESPVVTGSATHTVKFWPAITNSAVIHYRYEARPPGFQTDESTATADSQFPYGADDHSDTILYSCLSEAERRLDREAGVYKMRFMEALASSIEKDGRANRPELLGYNSDQSDGFDPEHTRIFGGPVRHKQQNGTFLE